MALPPRTEHKLSHTQFARTQLTKFANALYKWRLEGDKKLSRRALGAKVGCSESQIANIEKKKSYPSFPVYVALCREMDVEPMPGFPTADKS